MVSVQKLHVLLSFYLRFCFSSMGVQYSIFLVFMFLARHIDTATYDKPNKHLHYYMNVEFLACMECLHFSWSFVCLVIFPFLCLHYGWQSPICLIVRWMLLFGMNNNFHNNQQITVLTKQICEMMFGLDLTWRWNIYGKFLWSRNGLGIKLNFESSESLTFTK